MRVMYLKNTALFKILFFTVLISVFCPLAMWGQELGDVDINGNINIIDALLVAQYYVNLNPGGFYSEYADTDGNGSISIIDALLIAQYYVGLITEFPGANPQQTPGPTQVPGEDTTISLNGNSITVNGAGATVSGTVVTISSAGSYIISGTLNDGQVLVDSADTENVNILLNGVDIHNSSGSPFAVMNAEKVNLNLAANTTNYLSDTANYIFPDPEDDEPNATLFSKDDLDIKGSGTLYVDANYNDGIATKDDLDLEGGTIIVDAVDDGVRGKDSLEMKGATVIVTAGGDGFKSDDDVDGRIGLEEGTADITAQGDGMQAEVEFTSIGGNYTITAGGGHYQNVSEDESAMGIKGLVSMIIDDGIFNIDTADDGMHSNTAIDINGGQFSIATGDDGIHADETLTINGGTINVTQSYEGIESANLTINNGNINITADDDGVNAAGGEGTGMPGQPGEYYLNINGGYIVVIITDINIPGSTGGDGLDCNGYMTMTNGTAIVHGNSNNVDSAIDYDGSFTMNGGFIVGSGTNMMAMAPGGNDSAQNALLYNFDTQQGNTLVNIQTNNGASILTFAPNKQYSSIAFSSPQLTSGTTFNIYFGGSYSGTQTDGLYQNGSYNPGSLAETFTVNSKVTRIGSSGWPPF